MKNMVWLAALLLCFGSVLVVAQSGVDLSGSWVMDPSQSDNPGGMGRGRAGSDGGVPVGGPPGGRRMGAGRAGGDMPPAGGRGMGMPGGRGPGMMAGAKLVIRQSGNLLNITHVMGSGERERVFEQNFALDGSENVQALFMGQGTMTSTATWVMDTLVIQGKQTLSTPEGETTVPLMQEYSLANAGKTLILKTTHATPMGERAIKQVYVRQ